MPCGPRSRETWRRPDKSAGSFSRKLGTALARRAGTRYGEDSLHIVRAGSSEGRTWKLELGSTECEFVSLVSLYDPSAGKKYERKKYRGPKQTQLTHKLTPLPATLRTRLPSSSRTRRVGYQKKLAKCRGG